MLSRVYNPSVRSDYQAFEHILLGRINEYTYCCKSVTSLTFITENKFYATIFYLVLLRFLMRLLTFYLDRRIFGYLDFVSKFKKKTAQHSFNITIGISTICFPHLWIVFIAASRARVEATPRGSVLSLTNVTVRDAGVFSCLAHNGVPRAQPVTIREQLYLLVNRKIFPLNCNCIAKYSPLADLKYISTI